MDGLKALDPDRPIREAGSRGSFFGSGRAPLGRSVAGPRANETSIAGTRQTHPMPAHDGVRPDNGYGVQDAREAAIEPDEQGTIGPTQIRSASRSLLQDIELMPKDQDFSLQPPSRLKAVA